jgi:hypothetical protein
MRSDPRRNPRPQSIAPDRQGSRGSRHHVSASKGRRAYRNAGIVCSLIAVLTACTPPRSDRATVPSVPEAPSATDALAAAYERGIRSAAVRDPGFSVPLRTIPREQAYVTVAHFTEWGLPVSPTERPLWVSLPDQLRDLCHDKPDAVLALEQILGLPPRALPHLYDHQWQVITFQVPRAALFRPCPGGTDIAAPECLDPLAAAPTGRRDPTTLDDATARFLLDQIWSSDRVGFRAPNGDPDWGYPFTGMGWTYNWDPQAPSPVGVAEFVVRKATRVSQVAAMSPDRFCGG